jgi:hypothetical protein
VVGQVLFVQPEELGWIIPEHLDNVFFRNAETKESADEDPVSLDAFHVENLAKISPDDAPVGPYVSY